MVACSEMLQIAFCLSDDISHIFHPLMAQYHLHSVMLNEAQGLLHLYVHKYLVWDILISLKIKVFIFCCETLNS